MRTASPRVIAALAAIVLLAVCFGLARAANSTIGLKHPTDLMLPAASAPIGFTTHQSNGRPISNTMLLTVLGKHMSYIFHKDGWITGYHGWLDANNPVGDSFVTYDFYGFKSGPGARAALASYQGLVLGVQYPSNDGRLPLNATIFIDSTGTFGPSNQSFTVVEIVFPVNNVLADVTGYYAGGDASAADAARELTISATSGLASWLFSQSHPAQHSSLLWPVVPIGLLVPFRRAVRGRRGA